jgi:transcription antitermination factor NusG
MKSIHKVGDRVRILDGALKNRTVVVDEVSKDDQLQWMGVSFTIPAGHLIEGVEPDVRHWLPDHWVEATE